MIILETAARSTVASGPAFLMLLLWGVIIALAVLVIRSNRKRKELQKQRQQEAKGSVTERLDELGKLLESGMITQEEFDAKKKQILGL